MIWKIDREDSKYNKAMKWHLVGISDLVKTSNWYKTRKEAEYSKALFEKQLAENKYSQV